MVEQKTDLKTTLVGKEINVVDDRRASVKYEFVLKPVFIISSVRLDSPGAEAGFKKDDKLIKVNGIEAYQYKLDDLNQLMRSEDGKWITIEVERKGEIFKAKFQLKKMI
jgi:C-terminal processing protease CtpA/Prc